MQPRHQTSTSPTDRPNGKRRIFSICIHAFTRTAYQILPNFWAGIPSLVWLWVGAEMTRGQFTDVRNHTGSAGGQPPNSSLLGGQICVAFIARRNSQQQLLRIPITTEGLSQPLRKNLPCILTSVMSSRATNSGPNSPSYLCNLISD